MKKSKLLTIALPSVLGAATIASLAGTVAMTTSKTNKEVNSDLQATTYHKISWSTEGAIANASPAFKGVTAEVDKTFTKVKPNKPFHTVTDRANAKASVTGKTLTFAYWAKRSGSTTYTYTQMGETEQITEDITLYPIFNEVDTSVEIIGQKTVSVNKSTTWTVKATGTTEVLTVTKWEVTAGKTYATIGENTGVITGSATGTATIQATYTLGSTTGLTVSQDITVVDWTAWGYSSTLAIGDGDKTAATKAGTYIYDYSTIEATSGDILAYGIDEAFGSTAAFSRENFNKAISVGSYVGEIGDNFLYGCEAFNQTLTIPANTTSIGSDFMTNCYAFAQTITVPASVGYVGSAFMNGCKLATTVIVNTPAASIETVWEESIESFATEDATKESEVKGTTIKVVKDSQAVTAFRNKFDDRSYETYSGKSCRALTIQQQE